MLNKIKALPIKIYLAAQQLSEDLNSDERGLSDIVVAVMLILVGVLAAIMMWTFLGTYIGEMWDTITNKSAELK